MLLLLVVQSVLKYMFDDAAEKYDCYSDVCRRCVFFNVDTYVCAMGLDIYKNSRNVVILYKRFQSPIHFYYEIIAILRVYNIVDNVRMFMRYVERLCIGCVCVCLCIGLSGVLVVW